MVSIIIPVLNEEKNIRLCLKRVYSQTYRNFEVIVFDNGSTDQTSSIVRKEFPAVKIFNSPKNLFVGGAMNYCLKNFNLRKYILLLCSDVILDPNFLEEGTKILDKKPDVGVVQGKILKFDSKNNKKTNIIDTTGFEFFRNRRIINRGHGQVDQNQYPEGDIFSFEGAVALFRHSSLLDSMINNEFFDQDFEWMADDLDLGWRMNLFGWRNYYCPRLIAYHDRKTTKRTSRGRLDFIRQRKTIPAKKRMLDFCNFHLTIVKNDNIPWPDWPGFLWREIQLWIYVFVFEWSTWPAIIRMIKLLPKTIRKRKEIMNKIKSKIKEKNQKSKIKNQKSKRLRRLDKTN